MKPPLLALLAIWISCQAQPSDAEMQAPDGNSGWEQYRILVQRNIFARDRGRMRHASKDSDEMGPPAPKVDAETVLLGVLDKDGQLVAFLENTRTAAVQMLHTDDPVARGKVGAITLDSIEYVCGGSSVLVGVGKNLEGGATAALGESFKSPVTDSSGNPVPADTNSVLERLRKKRLEEMNK